MNWSKTAKEFGLQVRIWRVGEGLSLSDLAELLKITDVEMGTVERGVDNDVVTSQWPRIVYDLRRLGFGVSQ